MAVWICLSTGGFRVIAAAGCQVNPNTGEKVVGILSVDLPFWSVVTFDETHRKSLNLEPNDRVGFGIHLRQNPNYG